MSKKWVQNLKMPNCHHWRVQHGQLSSKRAKATSWDKPQDRFQIFAFLASDWPRAPSVGINLKPFLRNYSSTKSKIKTWAWSWNWQTVVGKDQSTRKSHYEFKKWNRITSTRQWSGKGGARISPFWHSVDPWFTSRLIKCVFSFMIKPIAN